MSFDEQGVCSLPRPSAAEGLVLTPAALAPGCCGSFLDFRWQGFLAVSGVGSCWTGPGPIDGGFLEFLVLCLFCICTCVGVFVVFRVHLVILLWFICL